MSEPVEEYDDFNEYDMPQCPHCMGSGEVPCHCGGDLCICENYGDAPCPVCFGEGEVTEERYERYFANQRKHHEMMRKILGDQS